MRGGRAARLDDAAAGADDFEQALTAAPIGGVKGNILMFYKALLAELEAETLGPRARSRASTKLWRSRIRSKSLRSRFPIFCAANSC